MLPYVGPSFLHNSLLLIRTCFSNSAQVPLDQLEKMTKNLQWLRKSRLIKVLTSHTPFATPFPLFISLIAYQIVVSVVVLPKVVVAQNPG